MNMYDIALFGLGVYTGVSIWKSLQSDAKVAIAKAIAMVAVAIIYFAPAGYAREVDSYEVLPSETYVVSDGTSTSEWNHTAIATVYTNNREFISCSDDTPLLLYNPDSYTADEAREIYKNK